MPVAAAAGAGQHARRQRDPLHVLGVVAGVDVRAAHRLAGGRIEHGVSSAFNIASVRVQTTDEVAVVVAGHRLPGQRRLRRGKWPD